MNGKLVHRATQCLEFLQTYCRIPRFIYDVEIDCGYNWQSLKHTSPPMRANVLHCIVPRQQASSEESSHRLPPATSLLPLPGNLQTAPPDAGGDVHFARLDKEFPISRVDLPAEIQCNDDGGGEKVLKKDLGVGSRAEREQGGVEGGDDGDAVEEDADVRAVDAERGLVGQLVFGEAMGVPSVSEPWLSQSVNTVRRTRQGKAHAGERG